MLRARLAERLSEQLPPAVTKTDVPQCLQRNCRCRLVPHPAEPTGRCGLDTSNGNPEIHEGGLARYCTRCGHRVTRGDQYCAYCGAAIRGASEPVLRINTPHHSADATASSPTSNVHPVLRGDDVPATHATKASPSASASAAHDWSEIAANCVGSSISGLVIFLFVVTFQIHAHLVKTSNPIAWDWQGPEAKQYTIWAALVFAITGFGASLHKNDRGWNNLAAGEYGLARTFWLFAFAPTLVLVVLQREIDSAGLPGAASLLALAGTAWQVLCAVGVWNAASQYAGPTIWRFLAKGWVVLFTTLLLLAISALALRSLS